ncbi:hypothetical protein BGZ73_008143 [Actinomortierella ambigua]|nr:hypothetical protein BGZ73_008143 [Actinomortierella ambigua]
MGRYEMAYSVQTLSRHRNAAQQEGAVPIIPETATRAQRRHIDKMVEEGRVPATPPPDSEDGLITLRITSITFASRDELKRAVGLMPGFRINGLNGNQALPILQRDEPADDPANRSKFLMQV